jgi:ADP-ribose pyrophosphatase YjhB (NUDIX family)
VKLDFALPTDGKMHRFCIDCRAENVNQVHIKGKTAYYCNVCGHTNVRAIYFKKHRFWIDKNGTLWHESAGVFVRNKQGKYLFFLRTEFPFLLTVPSGHVDNSELPKVAAMRELEEEVKLKANRLTLLGTENIHGDSCSAGADDHKWHSYLLRLDSNPTVKVREEGKRPVWLSIKEAKSRDLTFVIRQMVNRYEEQLNEL